MQSESKTQEFDGKKFTVFMLPPRQARGMLVDMTKVLAPAFGAMAGSEAGGFAAFISSEVSTGRFNAAVVSLMDRLDETMLDNHMKALASVTQVDGVTLDKTFDIIFLGNLGMMFKWYIFALKVNFEDFTNALGNATSVLRAPKAQDPA